MDWKSDVAPGADLVAGYRARVREYLRATGAGYGMLVFVTSGQV